MAGTRIPLFDKDRNALSAIVGGVAASLTAVGIRLGRPAAPPPVAIAAALGRFGLLHAGVAGFVVASAASAGVNNAGVLGKAADGSFPLWSELAFAPFHQTLRAWTRLKRHLRREEPLHDAVGNSGWHIGGWPSSADELPRGKPLAVLDVTAELPRAHEQPHYLNLAVWDMHGVEPDHIERGVRWGVKQRRSGRHVLVHCAHGHGRSASVLCAALVREGAAPSWQAAERLLQRHRPRVHLNAWQRSCLAEWEARYERPLRRRSMKGA